MMEQQKEVQNKSMMLMQSSDTGLQLQKALEQISTISTVLCDIQRYYQDQVCGYNARELHVYPLRSIYVSFVPVCR